MELGEKQLNLARHYLEIGQPQRTLDALAQVDGVDLHQPDAWRLRAAALYNLRDFAGALEAAESGLSNDPHDTGLLLLSSMAMEALGDLAGAEEAILAALDLAPEDGELLAQYADLLVQGGWIEKAERVLAELERVDPDSPDAIRGRMAIAYVRGNNREGRRLAERLLEYDPENHGAHRMLGAFKVQQGVLLGAAEHFETAARVNPLDPDAVAAAREARYIRHPLIRPLLPFERFGVGPTWIAAIVVIFGLRAAGLHGAAGVATIAWVLFCLYSWTVPPALRRHMERQYE